MVDTEAPRITCPPSVSVPAALLTASYPAALVATAPRATDNSGSVLTTSNFTAVRFGLGTTVVAITARDGAGNTAACLFNVTVRDTQPPKFVNCPTVRGIASWWCLLWSCPPSRGITGRRECA